MSMNKTVMEDVRLSSSSPRRIWVKYGDGQPARIDFEGGEVYDLKKRLRKSCPTGWGMLIRILSH